MSLLVHAAAVGGLLRHSAEPRPAPESRRVSVAPSQPAGFAPAGAPAAAEVLAPPAQAETLPPPDVPLPPLRAPAEPVAPPGAAAPDEVAVLLPRPVAPLSAPDLLPPAASVLVSIRAVRPPAPPVALPEVLAPDVLAARASSAPPSPADAARPDVTPPLATPSAAAADAAAVVAPEPAATNRPPRYPALSRRLGEQGEVLIRAVVGEDGRVLEAEVTRSSGHRRLDEAALAAIRTWTFLPATRAGRPVVHPLEIPVLFELQE